MGAALFWGLVAGSSLVVGALVAITWSVSSRTLGVVSAFGAGVLISAVSYELVLEANEAADRALPVAFGLFAGAVTFTLGDIAVDRMGGADRKRAGAAHSEGAGLGIVLGTILDGIPEAMVIGISLIGGGSVGVAVLVAVFLSNVPEAVAATSGLRGSGWSTRRVLVLWSLIAAVTSLSSLAGFALLDGVGGSAIAFVLAYAAGAILAMLADTMIPEAFSHGGRLAGLAMTVGFAVAAAITLWG